jgi:hypothetical protein
MTLQQPTTMNDQPKIDSTLFYSKSTCRLLYGTTMRPQQSCGSITLISVSNNCGYMYIIKREVGTDGQRTQPKKHTSFVAWNSLATTHSHSQAGKRTWEDPYASSASSVVAFQEEHGNCNVWFRQKPMSIPAYNFNSITHNSIEYNTHNNKPLGRNN